MNRSRSVLNKNYKNDSNPLKDLDEDSQNTQTKTNLPEVKTLYGKSPYSLKLQKIIDELAQIDPNSLMQKVDPTIDSTKTIQQIQTYYNGIKKEINTFVRQEKLEEEKAIYVKQLQEEGKPANIIDKIVIGKLNKFYSQICLIEQPYMREEKETIKKVIEKVSKDIVIKNFARFKIGE